MKTWAKLVVFFSLIFTFSTHAASTPPPPRITAQNLNEFILKVEQRIPNFGKFIALNFQQNPSLDINLFWQLMQKLVKYEGKKDLSNAQQNLIFTNSTRYSSSVYQSLRKHQFRAYRIMEVPESLGALIAYLDGDPILDAAMAYAPREHIFLIFDQTTNMPIGHLRASEVKVLDGQSTSRLFINDFKGPLIDDLAIKIFRRDSNKILANHFTKSQGKQFDTQSSVMMVFDEVDKSTTRNEAISSWRVMNNSFCEKGDATLLLNLIETKEQQRPISDREAAVKNNKIGLFIDGKKDINDTGYGKHYLSTKSVLFDFYDQEDRKIIAQLIGVTPSPKSRVWGNSKVGTEITFKALGVDLYDEAWAPGINWTKATAEPNAWLRYILRSLDIPQDDYVALKPSAALDKMVAQIEPAKTKNFSEDVSSILAKLENWHLLDFNTIQTHLRDLATIYDLTITDQELAEIVQSEHSIRQLRGQKWRKATTISDTLEDSLEEFQARRASLLYTKQNFKFDFEVQEKLTNDLIDFLIKLPGDDLQHIYENLGLSKYSSSDAPFGRFYQILEIAGELFGKFTPEYLNVIEALVFKENAAERSKLLASLNEKKLLYHRTYAWELPLDETYNRDVVSLVENCIADDIQSYGGITSHIYKALPQNYKRRDLNELSRRYYDPENYHDDYYSHYAEDIEGVYYDDPVDETLRVSNSPNSDYYYESPRKTGILFDDYDETRELSYRRYIMENYKKDEEFADLVDEIFQTKQRPSHNHYLAESSPVRENLLGNLGPKFKDIPTALLEKLREDLINDIREWKKETEHTDGNCGLIFSKIAKAMVH